MQLNYNVNGKKEDNYSDPEYLGTALKELDRKLIDFGHELDIKINVKIIRTGAELIGEEEN